MSNASKEISPEEARATAAEIALLLLNKGISVSDGMQVQALGLAVAGRIAGYTQHQIISAFTTTVKLVYEELKQFK